MEEQASARSDREHNISKPRYLEDRGLWKIYDFEFVDEPIIWSLLKYRGKKNRKQVTSYQNADVSGSKVGKNSHKPILDLDFNHAYVDSTQGGHAHLYLNRPISTWRWVALMVGLRLANVIEPGFFMWSMRRGQNFARLPHVKKKGNEQGTYTYGWFFKLKSHK